jgi:succinate dehydrogenase / fumarate reductase iron-sulfur subunit
MAHSEHDHHSAKHGTPAGHGGAQVHHDEGPESVTVRVRRRENPDAQAQWEEFRVAYEPGLNITSVLQRIAANPVTTEGKKTTPVSFDACCLEEVCGACTMVINGRVRQACSSRRLFTICWTMATVS